MTAVAIVLTLSLLLGTVYVLTGSQCCCGGGSSSSSKSSVSRSVSAPTSASASRSVSASASASGSGPVPSRSGGPGVCCPALPPQLGAFFSCVSSASTSQGTFQPPPTPVPPPPGGGTRVPFAPDYSCQYCAGNKGGTVGTPTYWKFTGFFFASFLQCFNGDWLMAKIPGSETCSWISDPSAVCVAVFTLGPDPDCDVQLQLTNRLTGDVAVYFGKLANLGNGCDCCVPVQVTLSSSSLPTAVPTTLLLTPLGCFPDHPPDFSSSSVSQPSAESCACHDEALCFNLQHDNSYVAVGACATIQLVCTGTGPTGWVLVVTINGVTFTYQAQPGSVCDPFNLRFFNVAGCCGEWHVVVNTDTWPCGSSSSSSSESLSSSSVSSSASVDVVSTQCCPQPVNTILYANFSNISGCATLDGKVVPLTWNGVAWQGTFLTGSGSATIAMKCLGIATDQGIQFFWNLTMLGACTTSGNNVLATDALCTPVMMVTFNPVTIAGCCTGTIKVVVIQ